MQTNDYDANLSHYEEKTGIKSKSVHSCCVRIGELAKILITAYEANYEA